MEKRKTALFKKQSDHPRAYQSFKYAYPVISRRSGGASIGVNLNHDKKCNFDCPYCQVDRSFLPIQGKINCRQIHEELEALLSQVDSNGIINLEGFNDLDPQDRVLKDIALSGDGEPTMVPEFEDVCETLFSLQHQFGAINFKLVLITNATLLHLDKVQRGVDLLLAKNGSVWAKLDAGTQQWYDKVNISRVPLDKVLKNIIQTGRKHPVVIQSLFFGLEGELPSQEELDAYVKRLEEIKKAEAEIELVQIHSLARKPAREDCFPAPQEMLLQLRDRIISELGIKAVAYQTS